MPGFLLPYVQIACLTGLALCLLRSETLRGAAAAGWLFGLGNFCTGLYWIFISLHTYGGLAAPLAVGAVLALSCGLALYYALATSLAYWCKGRVGTPTGFLSALASSVGWASSWTLFEWLRGTAFTGFPWLNLGYAHIDGPFHGWAPILGVYGLTWLSAFVSMALALLLVARRRISMDSAWRPGEAPAAGTVVLGLLMLLIGLVLSTLNWSRPHGESMVFRLTQGNISQSEKFDPALMQEGLETYMRLAAEPAKSEAASPRTIVTPETVMVLFQDNYLMETWEVWQEIARRQNASLIIGVPLHQIDANGDSRYTNSVVGLDAHSALDPLYAGAPEQRYDKHHLVPFGEFIPQGFRWFVNAMNIPLGDFNRGGVRQPLFNIDSQQVALNICYEDVFGEEILHAVRHHPAYGPGASILLNVSNLGWFGDSWALRQHLQISRMRALETARPMLRATNTGMTGAIAPDGQVQAMLPAHTRGILDVEVQGTEGMTPYVRWGNSVILALSLVGLAWSLAFAYLGRRKLGKIKG